MANARTPRLKGLAHSIVDARIIDGDMDLAVAHHIDMLTEHKEEIEDILATSVNITHLAMLEEAYKLGDIRWQVEDLRNQDSTPSVQSTG